MEMTKGHGDVWHITSTESK